VHTVDLNGDGDFIDPPKAIELGEMEDTRTYNQRNELRRRVVKDAFDNNGLTIDLDYTLNGQLKDDGQKYTYTYNPWGQLVAVKDRISGNLLAEYTYNGLGMRLTERTDTNDPTDAGQADGVVDAHDPVFFLATDLQGRRTAVFRAADEHPKETYVYHAPTTGAGPLAAAAGRGGGGGGDGWGWGWVGMGGDGGGCMVAA
jgi:YD repeat-containing protein